MRSNFYYANMGKKGFSFTLLGLLLLLPLFLTAQSSEDKLLEFYGEERVETLQEERPRIYEYKLFKLEHSYQLISAVEGKGYPKLEEIPYYTGKAENSRTIPSSELLQKLQDGSFNPLMCRLERSKEVPRVYELKGTGKVLLFRSEDELARKFNER